MTSNQQQQQYSQNRIRRTIPQQQNVTPASGSISGDVSEGTNSSVGRAPPQNHHHQQQQYLQQKQQHQQHQQQQSQLQQQQSQKLQQQQQHLKQQHQHQPIKQQQIQQLQHTKATPEPKLQQSMSSSTVGSHPISSKIISKNSTILPAVRPDLAVNSNDDMHSIDESRNNSPTPPDMPIKSQQPQQLQQQRQQNPQQLLIRQQQQQQQQQQQPSHLQMQMHQPYNASAINPASSATSSYNTSTASNNVSTIPHHSSQVPFYQNQNHLPQQNTQNLNYLANQQLISIESPLPTSIQRGLGDRSNEKRKTAALEIETLIKHEVNNFPLIASIIAVLSKDFCTSMNSNYRKGGLVGLAATAIGLSVHHASSYLNVLLPPVLHCFDDPESRVRYYACESLYNIAKVSRISVLFYFNLIFDGLTKLFADVDVDVKNGANLLDRLIKDIVTEAGNVGAFQIEQFLPLLQNYIRRTNPYIRQLIVGWITLLDSIPDISMLDYLPDFLDGLFNMLSDTNREIRQAADSALSDFLRELIVSTVFEFGSIISILVDQCKSSTKERLNRLTAITWLAELTHHPRSNNHLPASSTTTSDEIDSPQKRNPLIQYHADILSAIMYCISDNEREIRLVAERTNDDLLQLVKDTKNFSIDNRVDTNKSSNKYTKHRDDVKIELRSLLDVLTSEMFLKKDDVATKMAILRWINMLLEKFQNGMNSFTTELLPILLNLLSDPSDDVILLNIQVLSRISLSIIPNKKQLPPPSKKPNMTTIDNDKSNISAFPIDEEHGEEVVVTDDDDLDDVNDDAKDHLDIKQATSSASTETDKDDGKELQFQLVLTEILRLFAKDRKLLETRGSLIIRKLCVLLNAKSVYIRMAHTLSSMYEKNTMNNDQSTNYHPKQQQMQHVNISVEYQHSSLQFISTMIQTLNLILLTASELHDLRSSLGRSFVNVNSLDHVAAANKSIMSTPSSALCKRKDKWVHPVHEGIVMTNSRDGIIVEQLSNDGINELLDGNNDIDNDSVVFATLYNCWCHNPVATFSLCLLAQAYDLSFALIQKFSQMEDVTVGFLMQLDKLVYLLESPAFVHLRLQLLNVDAIYHASLLKSIYGILMCLPQGDAYRLLNDRLATVCNLRDNLGISNNSSNHIHAVDSIDDDNDVDHPIVGQKGLDMKKLLERFDSVMEQHLDVKRRLSRQQEQQRKYNNNAMVHTNINYGKTSPNAPSFHEGNMNTMTSVDERIYDINKPQQHHNVVGAESMKYTTGGNILNHPSQTTNTKRQNQEHQYHHQQQQQFSTKPGIVTSTSFHQRPPPPPPPPINASLQTASSYQHQ